MTELPEVLPATGTAGLAWLLFALPAFGAVVLLIAGRRADRWGHWLGVATVAAAFVVGLLIFFDTLALAPEQRTQELSLYRWFGVGSLQVDFGLRIDPLSLTFVLLITGVGALIHLYSVGYMAHDPGPAAVLRPAQPVRHGDAAAGAGQQLRDALPRLGGRRPGLVPADRLVPGPPVRRHGGEEGVPHEPGRRRRPGDRDLPDAGRTWARCSTREVFARVGELSGGVARSRSRCCCCSAPAASPASSRCRPGSRTRWRARPRSRRSSTPRRWSPPGSTSSPGAHRSTT